ncbi:outer membrane protein transport protein [Shewanella sp. AS1]|uniref:outer membrane protein transport protein n=1 Tax=Shewanella sp. AS1 TaxID=2907626 RepID=UPI001F33ADC8|nr:outer membrane protein transport protein [Shewanella sp. AS1]MCE9680306.1 outer membrane protein transport protein [Shewanella sp. AS1]
MKKKIVSLALTAAIYAPVFHLHAAGFQLAEYSATGLGRAFAGEAAMADNASAQGRNPALLTQLQGQQFSFGGIYVMPNVDIEGEVNLASPLLGGQTITIAGDANDVADNALVPNFYYSQQLSEQWYLGLAVNSHYGLATGVADTHATAIFGNETAVTTVEFNPNLAYQLTEDLSVGAGLRLVYGDGKISASAPAWIDTIKAIPGVPVAITVALPPAGSSLKTMEGDDIALGWKLGASWQINPAHRLGLAYHSGVKLELDGYAGGVVYDGGQDWQIEGYVPLELPAFTELASYHQLTDNWALHASVNWTQWHVFKQLVAYFPGQQKPVGDIASDLVKEENFKDSWRFALGSSYWLSNTWSLRAGVALDKTAVDDEHRTITIPDSDRLWLSVGTGYQLAPTLLLDMGVTYIKAVGEAPINEEMTLLNMAQVSFNGETRGDVWLVGAQLSYKM